MIFKKSFKEENNIKIFFDENEITKKIKNFYNQNPFPNYEKNETPVNIIKKGDKNFILKQIAEKMKFEKNILEVGSGTCQLSVYLALKTRSKIFALDATKKSLELGENFSTKFNIKNINFINANIFDDIFEEETFDLIWCSGVLHHTEDAYLGFKKILKYLKPNGYIIIGLYNKIGRQRTYLNKLIFKILGKKALLKIDPILRELNKKPTENKDKLVAWFRDQYLHPLETAHSYIEILNWFKKNKVDFINVYPKSIFDINDHHNFFQKIDDLTPFQTIFDQLNLFLKHSAEGGLFSFIGKK